MPEKASCPTTTAGPFTVRCGRLRRRIIPDRIRYVESDARKVIVHGADGEVISFYGRMSDMEETLCPCGFYRIHRCFLVSLSHVSSFSDSEVFMDGGETLILSRYRRSGFLSCFG